MRYLATGLNMLDQIITPAGQALPPKLGGVPLYGYCGMRVFTDDVLYLARVGNDFFDIYDPWFSQNGVPRQGLRFVSDKTPYCAIQYRADETVQDTWFFTRDWADSDFWRPQPEDYRRHIGPDTRGVCLCGPPQPSPSWAELFSLREKYHFQIMWEPNGSHTFAADRAATVELCQKVDMASFNLVEGCRIFGLAGEAELLDFLKRLGPELVLLRVGSRGMYTIAGGRAYLLPSAPLPPGTAVVDTTGCGNASTAACCYAWCETNDPVMTGIMGNVASSYNLRQYGPWPQFGPALTAEATDMADQLYQKYRCLL